VTDRPTAEPQPVGAAIGFSYDEAAQPAATLPAAQEPPSLRVLANCIEKTAEFIASQGAQMEILMRAKEANNLKFQFLNPGNPYHAIYKQVLEKKRSRPRGGQAVLTVAAASLDVERSLREVMASMPNAAPTLGPGQAGASSGGVGAQAEESTDAYSQLVRRIRVNRQHERGSATPPPAAPTTPTPPPQPVAEEKKEPELEEGEVLVTPPPLAAQCLIDQTASYAAKNGADKLAVLRKKETAAFAFLASEHPHNLFYQYKVALYKEMLAEKAAQEDQNGGGLKRPMSEEEQMAHVASKFPSLKGFFRQ